MSMALQLIIPTIIGLVWQFRDAFSIARAAPLSAPFAADTAGQWGSLTDSGNNLSISGGVEVIAAGAGVNDPRQYTGSFTRADGLVLFARINRGTGVLSSFVGWSAAITERPRHLAINVGAAGAISIIDNTTVLATGFTLGASTDLDIAIVLFTTGAHIWIKDSGTWKRLWTNLNLNTATLYAGFGAGAVAASGVNIDNFGVRTITGDLASLYGTASVNKTTFEQALGAELLVNGNFSAWTADNPDSWTITGEVGADPMITQVDPTGGAGTGAARFYSSATASRPWAHQLPAVAGSFYEVGINLTARTGGTLRIDMGTTTSPQITNIGIKLTVLRAQSTEYALRSVAATCDFVADDATCKLITLNTQQTGTADAMILLAYTLPGSPTALQAVELWYRISDNANKWLLRIRRNDANTQWDLNLYSVSAGTETSRIAVTNIGTTDTVIIRCEGTKHNVYTLNAGTPTKQGSEVNVSHNDSATGINCVATTGITLTREASWPTTSNATTEFDRTS